MEVTASCLLTGPVLTTSNVNKSSTHCYLIASNMHRKSQKQEAKNDMRLLGTLISSYLAKIIVICPGLYPTLINVHANLDLVKLDLVNNSI